MATLRQLCKGLGASLGVSRDDNETGYDMFDLPFVVKNAAASANANITIHRIYTNPFGFYLRITSLKWSPDANVAADATNYVTQLFSKDDGAGSAKTNAATLNTSNVAYVGNIAYAATLNATNCLLAPGASLYRTVTREGTLTHGADIDTIVLSRADSAD